MDCRSSIFEWNTLCKKIYCQLLSPIHLLLFLLVRWRCGICCRTQHDKTIIPKHTCIIFRRNALLQHCPKLVNVFIPFWEKLDWILRECVFKQAVRKSLRIDSNLLCCILGSSVNSFTPPYRYTLVMNSDDCSAAGGAVPLSKSIVNLAKFTRTRGKQWKVERTYKISVWITRDVKLPTTNLAGPTQLDTWLGFTQLYWEPLAGDCDKFLMERKLASQCHRRHRIENSQKKQINWTTPSILSVGNEVGEACWKELHCCKNCSVEWTLRRTTMPVGNGTEVEYRCRINVRVNWNDTTQHKHEPTLPVGAGTEVQYCCRIKVRQKRTNADNTNMNLVSQPLQSTIQTNEMKTLTPFSLTNNDTELGCLRREMSFRRANQRRKRNHDVHSVITASGCGRNSLAWSSQKLRAKRTGFKYQKPK